MAYTAGIDKIKIVNVASITVNAIVLDGDVELLDGVNFVGSRAIEKKMASGITKVISEGTKVDFIVVEPDDTKRAALKALNNTSGNIDVALDNGDNIVWTGVILNVKEKIEANEIPILMISSYKKDADIDSIAVYS